MKKYNLFLDDVRSPRDAWRDTHKTDYLRPIWDVSNAGGLQPEDPKYKELAESFHTNWIIIRSYDEFIQFVEDMHLNDGFPSLISFDHDLGEGKSGYDCAKWLVNFCMDHNLQMPNYLIHSMNPVGTENIDSLLKNFNKEVQQS